MTWQRRKVGEAECAVEVAEIVGKQRPRARVVGGHASVYTPAKTARAENVIAASWLEQVGAKWASFTGEVWVTAIFSKELAKSNPKYWAGRSDMQKPDIDNAMKTVLDALNGVAFADDCQITCCEGVKGRRTPHGTGCLITIIVSYYEETYSKERRK